MIDHAKIIICVNNTSNHGDAPVAMDMGSTESKAVVYECGVNHNAL